MSLKGLFATLVCLVPAFAVDKVYMPYFEVINVHSDYQYSTAKLFKGYVDDAGKFELVLPPRAESVVVQPPEEAVRKTAKELGCVYYLLGDMNRIGETVVLNLAMHATENGKRVWGDRLKASGPEDLDPIFQKLARALKTGSKAAEDGDIYSVTDYDSRELRQIQVKNYFGISVGGVLFTPGLLFGKDWNEPFVGGIGAFWAYDSRNVLFEMDAETYQFAKDSKLTSFSISAYKPFDSKSMTPFGGGGLGIGAVETEYGGTRTDGSGLVARGGGGIIFNRIATVQLRAQLLYQIGLFNMSSPRNDFPRMVIARMELAFGR